jgi:actin beta/gamma 1
MDTGESIVLDIGSSVCRAGLAGEDLPSVIFSSVVGRQNHKGILDSKEYYVGDEARTKRSSLNITHPIEQGIIKNWEDMEILWNHIIYNEFQVAPEDHPILMTETSFNPKSIREQTTQIIFEVFHAPGFYLTNQGLMSLFASGRMSGMVLQSGGGVTDIITVLENYILRQETRRLNVTGNDLTNSFKLFHSAKPFEFSEEIKEAVGYVAIDYDKEMYAEKFISFELPDGQVVRVGTERFRYPEALFQPHLLGVDSVGVHELIIQSLVNLNVYFGTRRANCKDIVLSGGSTKFPGFTDRLNKELTLALPPETRFNIVAYPERKESAWIGGAVVASLSTFAKVMISQAEYDEYGPSVVRRKCL